MSIDVFPATVLNSTLWNGQTYEEGTFTMTATGMTTTVTGTARYVRIGAMVFLFVPILTGTSNSAAMALTGVPAVIHTNLTHYLPISIQNNSVYSLGQCNVNAGGSMSVFVNPTGTGFVTTGGKGTGASMLVYVIQ